MGFIDRFQSFTKSGLKLRGFTFETRSFGLGSLTLWRQKFKKQAVPGTPPKRWVMIPGFGDTPLSWLPTMNTITGLKNFRQENFDELILVEFSGHLGSLGGAPALDSIDKLIAAVSSIVDELRPHTLMGHSMGGFLSAFYASELASKPSDSTQDFLQKLILLCPSGMNLPGPLQDIWDNMLRGMFEGEIAPFLERAIGPRTGLLFKKLTHNLITKEFGGFLRRRESLAILASFGARHIMNGRALKIHTPTLLIWGDEDPLIPFDLFEKWSQELTQSLGAKLGTLVIKNGSHALHVDSPFALAKGIDAKLG